MPPSAAVNTELGLIWMGKLLPPSFEISRTVLSVCSTMPALFATEVAGSGGKDRKLPFLVS